MDKSDENRILEGTARGSASNIAAESAAPRSRADMTEEEKKALKEEKKRRKEAEKAEKAARKAASAAAAAAASSSTAADLAVQIDVLSINDLPERVYGTYNIIQGACGPSGSGRTFVDLASVEEHRGNADAIWVRARVHKSDMRGNFAFVVLRKGLHTAQAVVANNKAMLKWINKALKTESIVDVLAHVVEPEAGIVEKCTVKTAELAVKRLYIVSASDEKLPMTLDDAARPLNEDICEEKRDKHQEQNGTDNSGAEENVDARPTVTRETRLDFRVLDIRVAPHACMLRLQSAICQLFREHLISKQFVEIHTPKLIAGASEGGANVFLTDYFGRPACLAQSPQLYKQMAVCGDLGRVFEIGPVFRAEKSDTHRHLCEFTGLDFEMEIFEHYSEILDVLDELFVSIFEGLETKFAKELDTVRAKWDVRPFTYRKGPERNVRLDWPDAINMLRENGVEMDDFEDLSSETEKLLGKIVQKKFDTDFFMLQRFPSAVRPFYTMTDPADSRYSNSFDVFMRGEEIISGAQRIHDFEMLKARATAMLGDEGVKTISTYIEAFRYGAWPHGGVGVGLERVLMLYLGVGNIRECTMFPRDPRRLTP